MHYWINQHTSKSADISVKEFGQIGKRLWNDTYSKGIIDRWFTKWVIFEARHIIRFFSFFVLLLTTHHSHTISIEYSFELNALLSPRKKFQFRMRSECDALASILLTVNLTSKYHTIHKISNIIDEYNNYCNHLLYVSFFSSFCHDSSPNGDYCDSFNLMETFQWIRPPIRVFGVLLCARAL